MFGTVRPPAERWGSFLDVLPLEAAAGSSRPGDPGAKPCRDVLLPKIEREEMRFLTPAEIVNLAEAHSCPPPGAGVRGRLRRPADRELVGLRPSRVDPRAGAVTVAEILIEVK